MSELDELLQEIETFKRNVASSNEVFDKMDSAIKETKRVSDDQADMQKDIDALASKTEDNFKANNETINKLETKIDALEKQNKKAGKQLLVASCVGAALGLVALILAVILLIK